MPGVMAAAQPKIGDALCERSAIPFLVPRREVEGRRCCLVRLVGRACAAAGVISTLSWGIGPIIGGPIVTRMRITVTRALCLTVVFHVVSFSGYLSALFVNCPEPPWAGNVDDDGSVPQFNPWLHVKIKLC